MSFNRFTGLTTITGIKGTQDLAERVARCEERGFEVVDRSDHLSVAKHFNNRGVFSATEEVGKETVVLRKIKGDTQH